MSSIFGLVHLDGSQVDIGSASAAAETLAHRGEIVLEHCPASHIFFSVRRHATGESVADGFQQNESAAPGVFEGIALHDLAWGHLSPRFNSVQKLATVAFVTRSIQEAMLLPGEFAAVVVADAQRRVQLFRDPVGLRTLYYFWNGTTVIFASEIKAILAHHMAPKDPDWVGLAGHCLGEASVADVTDTCYANIFSVPPGHCVSLELGVRPHLTKYWDFKATASNQVSDFPSACSEFRRLFLQSITRRFGGAAKAGVSLSGGLDSSSIYCSALSLGYRMPALSYVSEHVDRDETHFLDAIEKMYDAKIERYPVTAQTTFSEQLADQVHTVESPVVDYLWGVTCQLHQAATHKGLNQLASGHWGDQILFATGYLVDLFKSGQWHTLLKHTREYDRWQMQGFGRGELSRLPGEISKSLLPGTWCERLSLWRKQRIQYPGPLRWPEVRRRSGRAILESEFGSWQARQLYKMIRSKHFSHSLEWSNKAGASHGINLSFPLLDRDLLQFIITLPGQFQNQGGVPRALLRQSLKGILPPVIADRTWKADYSDVVNATARQDLFKITQRLKVAEIIKTQLVKSPAGWATELECLQNQLDGEDCAGAWHLYDLMALELFLDGIKKQSKKETRNVQKNKIEATL